MSSHARPSREGDAPIAPRIAIAGVLGAIIIGILVLRLWALTVLGGAEYAERADSNVIRRLPVAAPRGSILDREGRKIVVNVQMQQVVLDLQDVDEERLPALERDLARVLAPRPSLELQTAREIREKIDDAPPGAVEPVIIADDVTNRYVVAYLAEHAAEFPGVDVRTTYKRRYQQGSIAAHILGQVGPVDAEDLKTRPALQPIDLTGKSGIEKRYDEYLRGVDGYEAIKVDASGSRSDVAGLRGLPPTPGGNLITTIDLPLQKATERALKEGVRRAAATKDGRAAYAGAAVALDPKTGDVLAIASYPTFDPNLFSSPRPRDRRTVERLTDEKNKGLPMFNRAIMGLYPPGSTFKPITAIGALAEKYITPDQLIRCPQTLEIAGTKFPNNENEALGSIPLSTALEVSCNTYFFYLSIFFDNATGPVLQKWATTFGLGKPTGIDIPGEAEGLVPTPAWRKKTYDGYDELWKPGDSANLSIGQGDLQVTPLQMANVYATLGNGGILRTPHVAKRVEDAGGRDSIVLPEPDGVDVKLNPSDLAAVREGLKLVNSGSEGTGTAVFGSFPVPVAGKTGTAEKGEVNLAWYCSFAPADDPSIASCVFVDGGGYGGSAAAPIALKMYQQWFGEQGGNVSTGTAAN